MQYCDLLRPLKTQLSNAFPKKISFFSNYLSHLPSDFLVLSEILYSSLFSISLIKDNLIIFNKLPPTFHSFFWYAYCLKFIEETINIIIAPNTGALKEYREFVKDLCLYSYNILPPPFCVREN